MKYIILKNLVLLIFIVSSTQAFAQNRVVVVPLEVESSNSGTQLTRTRIVQGDGTNLENGANLAAAVAYVATKNPLIDDPWVIKVEPGIYYLGEQGITLPQGVSLVGSGSSSFTYGGTYIASSGEAATITISNSSIISDLSVINEFRGPSLTVMDGKNIIRESAFYAINSDLGVNILDGEIRIEDSIISAFNSLPSVTGLNIGLASVALVGSRVRGRGESDSIGINSIGSLSITDSSVTGRIINNSSEFISLIGEDETTLKIFGSELITSSVQAAITQGYPASMMLSHSKIRTEGGEAVALTGFATGNQALADSRILCDALTINNDGNRSFVGVGEGSVECSGL